MASTYPYISGGGRIFKVIDHLRKSFPSTISSDTLKKLGLAPNNETYVINILKFLNIIDEEGKKTDKASLAFSQHENKEFSKKFGALVKDAYKELFNLHGDNSWTLGLNQLISFFRTEDQTSAIVGNNQARTFQSLSALSGYAELPTIKKESTQGKSLAKEKNKQKHTRKIKNDKIPNLGVDSTTPNRDFGLTVRIEINLPAQADQDTYNKIFKSIRENLIEVD